MDHNLIFILAATTYSVIGGGLLSALMWAAVLDGREDLLTRRPRVTPSAT